MADVLNFASAKGKSKFAGTLIVIANSYSIKRIDHAFAPGKRDTKVNLKLIAVITYIVASEFGIVYDSKDANNLY